jgi:superfamily II DNA/RNA helicase
MTFDALGLGPEVLRAVGEAGYVNPTPIQEQAIPVVLMGRDVLGCAQTGTGKTAAFTLPMIDILASGRAKARMPRSLIITPTRELATQIAENFEIYGKYHKLSMALLIGGVSLDEQNARLDRGVDVLIATPGRLLDHFERGRVLLNDIKILVIDEADRMMDMGFIPDVERIVGLLPRIRQTLFFSATMPPEIRRLADKFLMNPKEISVTPNVSAAETVSHFLAMVPGDAAGKRDALRRLVRNEEIVNAIIFCNRKRDVDILFRSLKRHGFSAAALHGDMPQPVRLETLEAFKVGTISLLVASDVAARGLDLPKVSHVFNFDVPTHAEDYVHRIGRTGRAGRKGRAFTLATPDDGKFVDAIERFISTKIPRSEVEGVESAEFDRSADDRRGRGRRGRSRGKPEAKGRSDVKGRPEERREAPVTAVALKHPEPVAAMPVPGPVRSATPTSARPAHRSGPVRQGEDRPRHAGAQRITSRDEEPVVGMGSHVPAFMLRPVRTGTR